MLLLGPRLANKIIFAAQSLSISAPVLSSRSHNALVGRAPGVEMADSPGAQCRQSWQSQYLSVVKAYLTDHIATQLKSSSLIEIATSKITLTSPKLIPEPITSTTYLPV